mmetsp:Transcript_4915/g.21980  ORF Transcript_4915/g.21980 Transcript_4915/m.21980 type:complete len:276 (-) Transcript_4915:1170-1997(-)
MTPPPPPPSGDVVTTRRSGMVRRKTSAVHVPTAHSRAAASPGSERGVQSRHAISLPSSDADAVSRMSAWAPPWAPPWASPAPSTSMASPPAPTADPSAREYSEPPVVATSACVLLAEATDTVAPPGGDHVALGSPSAAFTSLTPDATHCTTYPPSTLHTHSVCSFAEKPRNSVSASSSSSSMARMRVSPANDTTRWVSDGCVAASPLRRLQHPLTPGSSTAARSWMPTPFRTIRRDPSLFTPEHITTCPCPCRSKSTTAKSTMGPRFVNDSRHST